MRMVAAFMLAAVLGLAAPARAEILPLPANLIALDSDAGEKLLYGAEASDDYLPLSLHFVTQDNPAFCGPASISMVLNALNLPRPPSDKTAGFGLFDQENIFDARTDTVKTRAAILKAGMTLDQLAGVLAVHDLKTDVHHAAESSVDAFRKAAIVEIDADDHFVLVNYLRSALGQETGGHISPVAAYDADTDRFLILDVSRYKYPPIWVTAADLFAAMNTPDADNGGKSRGYVFVSR